MVAGRALEVGEQVRGMEHIQFAPGHGGDVLPATVGPREKDLLCIGIFEALDHGFGVTLRVIRTTVKKRFV